MLITQSLSAECRALTDLFVATPIGGTITYADMTRAIGRDISARRYLCLRAIEVAGKEAGAIFGTVRGVGYRRLPPQDAHQLGSHARGRIRRTAKRAASAIAAALATANEMPDEAKRRAYAEVNALALIRHLATDRNVAAATPDPKPEPVGIIMRRFAEKIGAAG